MITVTDQVSPWLTPSSAFAATIQSQVGAYMSSERNGQRRSSQPATSTCLRPKRSASRPAR